MESTDPEIDDEAVRTATGRNWREWLDALSNASLEGKSHDEIVAWLDHEHSVPSWWRQAIVMAFERSIGRRDRREMPDGFEVEVEATFDCDREVVFELWSDEERRLRWLRRRDLEVTDLRPPERVRARWLPVDSEVEVSLETMDGGGTRLGLLHRKLPNGEAAKKMRSFWTMVMDRIRNEVMR